MSTPSGDSVRSEIAENALVAGNPVKTSAKAPATASKLVYVDSNSQLASGNIPFQATIAGVVLSGMESTSVSAVEVAGASNSDNADLLMQGQLVLGSRVTTFTKTGFIQVNITDSAGNLTDGIHYIQIGTLS